MSLALLSVTRVLCHQNIRQKKQKEVALEREKKVSME